MQHHYEGHWKAWALKIETFLGPEMAQAKRVPFGPKKVFHGPVVERPHFMGGGGGGWSIPGKDIIFKLDWYIM